MKAFDLSVLQSGYKHPGGGREALWPSGQYAEVGGELGEGFHTAGNLIPAVGVVTEILIHLSQLHSSLLLSLQSLAVSLSVIQPGTSYSFLALG